MSIENIANILYEIIADNVDKLADNSFMALTEDNEIIFDIAEKNYEIKIMESEEN